MAYLIRKATRNDIPCLEKLLNVYMQESFQRAWGGTAQRLEQHGFGHEFEMMVAEASDPEVEVVAFAAWVSSYDLHHCMKGGEVIDLYVLPSHRGQGVAMLLIARLAKEIQEHGGTYLKGQALDNPAAQRLYQRCARCFPGAECCVSGRGFRQLAELSGQSVREIVSHLPETAWNYEP
jgi:GNAT superfamily N-acetyltransferase